MNQNIPTIGVAFNLILIRAGQNRTRENTSFTDDYTGRGVSVMRYANNAVMSGSPKIIVDVSQETSTASSGTV
jgi:hypothetical protein